MASTAAIFFSFLLPSAIAIAEYINNAVGLPSSVSAKKSGLSADSSGDVKAERIDWSNAKRSSI